MLKKIRPLDFFLTLTPFLVLLTIWWLLYYFNLIPHWILRSPQEVSKTFLELLSNGTILRIVLISATNAIPAFLVAILVSLILGILIGLSSLARKIFLPFLSILYPIPSLAWLPFAILFLGFSRWCVWTVIFIATFLKLIFNVIGGVRNINRNYILAAHNLEIKNWSFIKKIIIPGSLPQVATGLRLAFGSSWRALVGAEILTVGVGGIGSFIWNAQWFFRFDQILVGIIILGLIGFLAEKFIFSKLEKLTLERWGLYRK